MHIRFMSIGFCIGFGLVALVTMSRLPADESGALLILVPIAVIAGCVIGATGGVLASIASVFASGRLSALFDWNRQEFYTWIAMVTS